MLAHDDESTIEPDHAFAWRFVAPLFMGSALNPVNSSMIATALVPIAHALGVSVGRTAVLVSVLYLASAIAQPTGGKLAEELGPRRVFLAGILLVLAGGVVGGLANDLSLLILARVLIGVGTSAGYPSAMLLIRQRAQDAGLDDPPGGVLAGLTIAGSVTAAVGLPLGGVLVGALGWRATFFVNVPVALITLAMAAFWIPADPELPAGRTARELVDRLDVVGMAGFGGSLAAVLVFLLSLPNPDWFALGVGIVLAAGLPGWELRAARPFFDVRLLARDGALSRTYLRLALTMMCSYTVLYGVTQWLQAGRHLSAEEAGLIALPMTAVSAAVTRPISSRNLVRAPLILGAMACLAGSAGVLVLSTGTPIAGIVGVALLFGITLGAALSANQTTLYSAAPAEQIGTASGLFRTFGYLGSIASSALISIVFHTRVNDHGLHTIGLIMVAVSVVGLIVVLADRDVMTLDALARSGGDDGTVRQPARPQER